MYYARPCSKPPRQLEGEVRVLKGELELERSGVTTLKETQTVSLLTAQITTLRSSDATSISIRDELERTRELMKELDEEAEGVRRGLHNLVVDLNGNIAGPCPSFIRTFLALLHLWKSGRRGRGGGSRGQVPGP